VHITGGPVGVVVSGRLGGLIGGGWRAFWEVGGFYGGWWVF